MEDTGLVLIATITIELNWFDDFCSGLPWLGLWPVAKI